MDYHHKLEDLLDRTPSETVTQNRRNFVAGAAAIYGDQMKHKGTTMVRAALARETRRDLVLLGELLLVIPRQLSTVADDRLFRRARARAVASKSTCFLPWWWIDYRWGERDLERCKFLSAARRLSRAFRDMASMRTHPPEIVDCLRRTVQ